MVQSVNTLLVAAAAFGALSAFGAAVPVKYELLFPFFWLFADVRIYIQEWYTFGR
jgi:hypothetical protein